MSDQDGRGEMRDTSPPDSLDETLARIQALIDEAIAILERRAARRT